MTIATYPNAKDPASPLDIVPLTGRIGAEIRGVTLSGDLDHGTVQAIEAALVRHKVIFFRGQQHLDNAEHEAFTSLFGDPVADRDAGHHRNQGECQQGSHDQRKGQRQRHRPEDLPFHPLQGVERDEGGEENRLGEQDGPSHLTHGLDDLP